MTEYAKQSTIATLAFAPVDVADLQRQIQNGTLELAPAVAAGLGFQKEAVQPKNGFYHRFGKRLMDLALTAASAPFVVPVMAVCAAALWVEGGNPFYTQDRLGREGRRFRILKLRTMVCDADQQLERLLEQDPVLRREWEETQKLKRDPRITWVGRFLRATSLDELPQLWNVLKGEMSLVGPRPMLPEQLELYGDPTPYFDMRPGLTGIWQVSKRNESGFSQRAGCDAQYHRRCDASMDAALIWKTFGVVLKRTGY